MKTGLTQYICCNEGLSPCVHYDNGGGGVEDGKPNSVSSRKTNDLNCFYLSIFYFLFFFLFFFFFVDDDDGGDEDDDAFDYVVVLH